MKALTKKIIVSLLIVFISINAIFPHFIYAEEYRFPDSLYEGIKKEINDRIEQEITAFIEQKETARSYL